MIFYDCIYVILTYYLWSAFRKCCCCQLLLLAIAAGITLAALHR